MRKREYAVLTAYALVWRSVISDQFVPNLWSTDFVDHHPVAWELEVSLLGVLHQQREDHHPIKPLAQRATFQVFDEALNKTFSIQDWSNELEFRDTSFV